MSFVLEPVFVALAVWALVVCWFLAVAFAEDERGESSVTVFFEDLVCDDVSALGDELLFVVVDSALIDFFAVVWAWPAVVVLAEAFSEVFLFTPVSESVSVETARETPESFFRCVDDG